MPLNHILRKFIVGYKLTKSQEKINHLMYMDDIKLFAKNEKELETQIQAVKVYSQGLGMEFGIEKCTMLIMRSRKQQMEGLELPNQEKIRTPGEKETYKYLGILEADKRRWKKKLKRIFQESDKTTRNQTISQKSHQKDKHLCCLLSKILGTILKVDERRTSTNGPKNKKTHDDA